MNPTDTPPTPDPEPATFDITLPGEAYHKIKDVAERLGLTLEETVKRLLRHYLTVEGGYGL